MKSVYVWTWKVNLTGKKWELCRFAMASKQFLLDEGKPSPEAKPIRVRMIYKASN